MRLDPADHPVFFCEQAMHNRDLRIKLVELLFEKYGVKSVFFHKNPILSSYIFAKENMILIDSGANFTHVVPI